MNNKFKQFLFILVSFFIDYFVLVITFYPLSAPNPKIIKPLTFVFFVIPLPVIFAFFFIVNCFIYFSKENHKFSRFIKYISLPYNIMIIIGWFYLFKTELYLNPFLFFAASFLIIVLIALIETGRINKPSRLYFLKMTSIMGCVTLMSIFMLIISPVHHCEKIVKNKNIIPLISYCEKDWQQKWTDKFKPFTDLKKENIFPALRQPRTLFLNPEDKNIIYLSFNNNKGEVPIVKFDRTLKKATGVVFTEDSFRIEYYKKKKWVLVASNSSGYVYVIDDKTFKIIRKIRAGISPIFMALDEEKDLLYVSCEHDKYTLRIYDLNTFKEITKLSLISGSIYQIVYDRYNKKIFATAVEPPNFTVIMFDTQTFKIKRKPLPYFPMGFTLDDKKGRLFVVSPFESIIFSINAKTLEIEKKFKTEFWCREITYNKTKRILYTGSYVNGFLSEIDADTGKVLKRFFVGRKIRDIIYDHDLKKLFVANANGFLEIVP